MARSDVGAVVHPFAAATVAGALSGLVVGGVLGRIGMRLITMLSQRGTRGLITDDGAVVGDVTLGGSIFLALFCVTAGALGGLVYLGVRPALPASRRTLAFGLLALVGGGGLFVHDASSVDFGLLGPRWLSVALFTLLPAGYGLLTAWLCERLRQPMRRLPVPAAATIGIAALTFPGSMVLGAVVLLVAIFVPWRTERSTAAAVGLARVAVLAIGALGLVSLVTDVATM